MSLASESVNSKDHPPTQFFAIPLPDNVRNFMNWILNIKTFHPIPRWSSVSFHYKRWELLILRLWGIDNSNNAMTELLLISSEDFNTRYWYELATPYFLINTSALPLTEQLQWYKWIRIDEVIRLGLHSDPYVASRLWLDKNQYISRHHMELQLSSDWEFVLRDLWSKNGTFINYPDVWTPNGENISKKSSIERNMEEIAKNRFLSTLWPNLSEWMKQWPVWNCYFVAAINSIKEHPKCASLLSQMVQPHTDGYRVQFLGINQFTVISNKDIDDMGRNRLSWSLWDLILERAYWRLRHDRYDSRLRWGFQQQIACTNWTLLATNHRWKFVHEWWWMKEVLSDFLGTLLAEVQSIDNLFLSANSGVLSHLRWDNLVTASSPSVEHIDSKGTSHIGKRRELFSLYFPADSQIYREAEQYMRRVNGSHITQDMIHERISEQIVYWDITWDQQTFTIQDINQVKRKFYFNHAYSIGRIDHASWYVELINPHDTLNERFHLSIDTFYKYFNNLTIARLSK
jgi:hypothetical protein